MGYSPWGPEELDTTEQLTLSPYIYIYISHVGCTVIKNLPADAGDIRDASLTHGSGGSPGGMATHSSPWGSKRVICG